MTKEEKAIKFVEEFVKHGFGIDTMPTRRFLTDAAQREGQFHEYEWWNEYVSGAERRLIAAARSVLE